MDGIGGGRGGVPVVQLFLLDEPDLAGFDRLGVVIDLRERLDHHGLGFDGGLPPPPVIVTVILPRHACQIVVQCVLLERAGDVFGGGGVAEPNKGERDMGAGHARIQAGPEAFGLGGEVVEGFLVGAFHGGVFKEKRAGVEVVGDPWIEVVGR